MKYAFVLGNSPSLSIIEICNVLKRENIAFTIETHSKEVLILEIAQEIDAKSIMNQLGGSIKIIEILKKFTKYSYKKLFPLLLSYLNEYTGVNTRIKFGFSLYLADKDLTNNASKHFAKRFFRLGMSLKSELKQKGESVKVVVSKERVLSSVILHKQKVLLQGEDFCLYTQDDGSFYLGKTLAYQDFEKYSRMDFGRPARDDKSGMLPPKLAKLLINISGVDTSKILLDPHCGSGTVLSEALQLGFNQVIGADLSEKAVSDSKINIAWLLEKHLERNDFDIQKNIFEADVQNISQNLEKNSVDVIVTEPYMGQGVTQKMIHSDSFKKDRVQTMHELEELYINTFREFKKIIKIGGVVVMIIPAFVVNKNTTIYAQVLEQIRGLGFEIETPFADQVKYSDRGSLVYQREGQHVVREVFRFRLGQ